VDVTPVGVWPANWRKRYSFKSRTNAFGSRGLHRRHRRPSAAPDRAGTRPSPYRR
jgi:hypothetical protein